MGSKWSQKISVFEISEIFLLFLPAPVDCADLGQDPELESSVRCHRKVNDCRMNLFRDGNQNSDLSEFWLTISVEQGQDQNLAICLIRISGLDN